MSLLRTASAEVMITRMMEPAPAMMRSNRFAVTRPGREAMV